LIDYGFIGNEVIEGFGLLTKGLSNSSLNINSIPGLSFYNKKAVSFTRTPEKISTLIDFNIINSFFKHSELYNLAFKHNFKPRLIDHLERKLNRTFSIEIARGCIKFKGNNACSFCSIQYGRFWKNQVTSPVDAWTIIQNAFNKGYDFLQVTADELPLTFSSLLHGMRQSTPYWFRRLAADERPVLSGYARSDGIAIEKNAKLLHDLGFRIIMIGIDGGPIDSLAALNKQLMGDRNRKLQTLYEKNIECFKMAKRYGLKIHVGFIIGHFGMDKDLLH